MYNFKIKIISLILLCVGGSLHPEMLIVKQQDFGFSSLSLEESVEYNDVIANILQKYQWPMCIGSTLTEHEKNELLNVDQSYAEELFIQKNLNEALPNMYLRVVFIPTSLYELFCLIKFYESEVSSEHQDLFYQALNGDLDVDFFDLLNNESISGQKVRMQIQQTFKNINNLFFKKQKIFNFLPKFFKNVQPSVWMNINNMLFKDLLEQFSEIQLCKNGQEISAILEKSTNKILKMLLSKAAMIRIENDEVSNYAQCVFKSEQDESRNKIIENVVRLEYEARKQNRAMLIRGSTLESMEVSMTKEPVTKNLIGTTVYQEFEDLSEQGLSDSEHSDTSSDSYQYQGEKIPFWKKYKEKNNHPYSISFGISLFAGLVNDPFACAYTYLSGCGYQEGTINDNTFIKPVGYVILINKKDYIDHQNFNLFYIPSLSTLPSLFEQSEFFHARVKAAQLLKNGLVNMEGVSHGDLIDPTGVLLITRDPLKHAELFSNFLVQNGRLIQPGDANLLTDAEKNFANDVMKAQAEVAQLYKAVKTMTPKIEKATKNFKEKRDTKFLNWMQDYQDL